MTYNSVQVFYHIEKAAIFSAQGKLGSVRHPPTLHLWVLSQAGTTLGISTNVISSAALGRDGHAAGHWGRGPTQSLTVAPSYPQILAT